MTVMGNPAGAVDPSSRIARGLTLLGELRRGQLESLHLADDVELGTRCAVKMLQADAADDRAIRVRFTSTARAVAALNHPALPKVYAMGEMPDGRPCCRMEYVEAPTLADYCRRRNEPLPLALILEIIAPICEALDLLHALHFVHLDLRPESIVVVSRKGQVAPRLLDWGVVRSDEAGTIAEVPGAAAFRAPEVNSGAVIDRASDVYSLSVLLYWMATAGHLPHEVPDSAMRAHQLHEPPVDPRRHVSELPELAWTVILNAINPDAARRPRSAGALALMLMACIEGGDAILRKHAPGVLVIGNLDETLRAPGARGTSRGQAARAWRYEYGPVLGRGGMAEVVRATLRGAGQFAAARAIKLILPEFAQSPEFVQMFHEEARVAALLEHRNIVRVLEHDIDPQDRPYLAMEFVDGVDLNKLIAAGEVPHDVTIFVLTEVLEALAYIHDLPPTSPLASAEEIAARAGARGLVHRDVSHHNVLVSWLLDVKLSDFGIAKMRTSTSAEGSKLLKGKAGYMAPEQAAASNKIDGRADLWAIGVMLWELLTGQLLFNQDNFAAVLAAVRWDEIPAPHTVRPDVPRDLEAVAMRLLERDLSRRFQTAQEVIAALRACHAASPDGRAALGRLLAERFPDRARPVHARPAFPQGLATRDSEPSSPALSANALTPPSEASQELSASSGIMQGEPRHVPTHSSSKWGFIAAALVVLVVVAISVRYDARSPGPSGLGSAWSYGPATKEPARPERPAVVAGSAGSASVGSGPVIAVDPNAAARPARTAPVAVRSSPTATESAVPSVPSKDGEAGPPRAPATSKGGEPPRAPASPGKEPLRAPVAQDPERADAPKVAEALGELVIVVKPWAMVSLNGKPIGQTPIHRTVPVGSYRIAIRNDHINKDETMSVTVVRGQTTTVERSWLKR